MFKNCLLFSVYSAVPHLPDQVPLRASREGVFATDCPFLQKKYACPVDMTPGWGIL